MPDAQDPFLVATGARLRKARLAAGINLHDLALLTGLSIGALSQIETGKRDPRLTTLARIAGALRRSPADFVSSDLVSPYLVRPDRADARRLGSDPGADDGSIEGNSEGAGGGYDLGEFE